LPGWCIGKCPSGIRTVLQSQARSSRCRGLFDLGSLSCGGGLYVGCLAPLPHQQGPSSPKALTRVSDNHQGPCCWLLLLFVCIMSVIAELVIRSEVPSRVSDASGMVQTPDHRDQLAATDAARDGLSSWWTPLPPHRPPAVVASACGAKSRQAPEMPEWWSVTELLP
jgi:hypothetical protein